MQPKMGAKQVSKIVEIKEAWRFNLSIWLSQALAAIAYILALLSLWFHEGVPEIPAISDAFEWLSRRFIDEAAAIRVPAIVRMTHSFYEDIPKTEVH